jgi:Ca2+-dependent lipid-binding protein
MTNLERASMGQNPGGQSSNGGQAAQSGQQTQNSRQNQPAQGTQQNQSAQSTQQNQPAQGAQQSQQAQSRQRDTGEQVASWFTETIVRTAVAVFGVALLLLALGQLAGVELLSTVVEFLASGIGVWLVVAFFAMLLIVAASKSWNISRQ